LATRGTIIEFFAAGRGDKGFTMGTFRKVVSSSNGRTLRSRRIDALCFRHLGRRSLGNTPVAMPTSRGLLAPLPETLFFVLSFSTGTIGKRGATGRIYSVGWPPVISNQPCFAFSTPTLLG
jgi:hypothetical protein